MLETIDKRIAKLQQIRALIVEEFGQPNGASLQRERRQAVRQPKTNSNGEPSRKQQIHNWLAAHGPASRSEVIAGTGLPDGTVGGYLSAEKGLFENRDGKWYAR
jgi:hypothetical protein